MNSETVVDRSADQGRLYDFMHYVEQRTLEHQPSLGDDDISKCLPGWVKTFCDKFESGEGFVMSPSAVSNLCHTLIAARARCHRLIRERDAALAAS